MSAIAFAEATGLDYFHTPFSSVEHGANPGEFAAEWEHAFGLGEGHSTVPSDVPVIDGHTLAMGYSGPPAIVGQPYFHGYVDKRLHLYQRHAERWRANLKLPNVPKDRTTIAVHIRRGDVGSDHQSRFTANETILDHIGKVRSDNPDARVVVLSQGEEANFRWLGEQCDLILNGDIFETIAIMIAADELIMAKSSLSYVCGILSNGRIHYQPFMHEPLSGWRVIA